MYVHGRFGVRIWVIGYRVVGNSVLGCGKFGMKEWGTRYRDVKGSVWGYG